MDFNDAAVHHHDMGDMDMDDMDIDVTGAELTTAMQGHQHLRKAEKRQKLLAQGRGGPGNVSQDNNSSGDGGQPGAPGAPGAPGEGEEAKKEPTCYQWFFGPALDAHDGSHSTGNALLDYYYEGDEDLKQEPIEIKHNSIERKLIYYAFAWLWCGCWEPKYKITNKYAIGEQWVCCPKDRTCTCCIKVKYYYLLLFIINYYYLLLLKKCEKVVKT